MAGSRSVPRYSRERITPVIAQELLEHNEGNYRPLNMPKVHEIARAMLNDEYVENWDCVGLDVQGNLQNAQHRLTAIVISGKTCWMGVARDLPVRAREVGDTGRKRTLADLLRNRGESNVALLASAIYYVWHMECGTPREQNACSNMEALRILDEHPGLRDSTAFASRYRKQIPALQSSAVAGLHYLTTQVDAELAESFWHGMATGENCGPGSPMLVLRKMYSNGLDKKGTRKLSRPMLSANLIKAWNQHYIGDGTNENYLRWRWMDRYPTLAGTGLPDEVVENSEDNALDTAVSQVA